MFCLFVSFFLISIGVYIMFFFLFLVGRQMGAQVPSARGHCHNCMDGVAIAYGVSSIEEATRHYYTGYT